MLPGTRGVGAEKKPGWPAPMGWVPMGGEREDDYSCVNSLTTIGIMAVGGRERMGTCGLGADPVTKDHEAWQAEVESFFNLLRKEGMTRHGPPLDPGFASPRIIPTSPFTLGECPEESQTPSKIP